MMPDVNNIYSFTYRPPAGKAATDSRRLRPNTENGTFDMVTTECLRPDGCGACDNVAKNSASFLLFPHNVYEKFRFSSWCSKMCFIFLARTHHYASALNISVRKLN